MTVMFPLLLVVIRPSSVGLLKLPLALESCAITWLAVPLRFSALMVPVRVNGMVKDKRFSLPILLKNGLKGAPQGAIRISQDEYKPLLDFIDTNFGIAPEDTNAAKKPRRAPFKFSMIGLKPGDIINFAPNGEEVRVNSENTVDYDGQILTLSRFCKIYRPDENSEFKEYQGPAHFTYKGKTLDEIRKEREK